MSPSNNSNTIFLTAAEDERLRKTFKTRLKQCHDLAGQARPPSDARARQNQIATASLLSDLAAASISGTKDQEGVIAYAVGTPYPPCMLSVQELQPMEMSELKMETHHRGRVLSVKRVADVVKLVACSWTVVQQEGSDEIERLEVGLHKSKHGQDILEMGDSFLVKEPYLTLSDQGEPTLRIDHPSDLIVCPEGKNEITVKTAMNLKEEGNAAPKKHDLILAHAKYTQGLQIVSANGTAKEGINYDLFRNRAHVNLLLSRFDEAKSDALASLTHLSDQKHQELDSKAYSRAGSAAYNLGLFQEAKHLFEHQQRLIPSDKEAGARIRKAGLRLQEQDSGSYDFKKLKASLMVSSRPRVDAASFTCNVKIGQSPGRGRGLFATKDVGAGDIILCEQAFSVVWTHEKEVLTAMTYDFRDERIRVFPAGLCKAVVQKLLDNPSQIGKIVDLYSDYRPDIKPHVRDGDGGVVIDVFQVHDIVARNAFGPVSAYTRNGAVEDSGNSAGLWVVASYTNHSCLPNAEKDAIGDLMILRATRKIAAGEEITHCYDGTSDYENRRKALVDTWGFECGCKLCVAEKEDSGEKRKKRRDLELEAEALMEKRDAGKRMAVLRARRIVKELEETYDERYKDLPKLAMARVQKWLDQAAAK